MLHPLVVPRQAGDAHADSPLQEIPRVSLCRAAKRYPRDFLERRIRVSITGLATYHERMEHAAHTG